MNAFRSSRTTPPFSDRHDAGKQLAGALVHLRAERPLVVGLPRGGVVVAYEVAVALAAPLDVVIARKLGAPARPELAIGAIGEDGVVLVDERTAAACGLDRAGVEAIVWRERAALAQRARRFRGAGAAEAVAGRTVVLVDDGIATGSTAQAAARVLRRRGASRIVLAVPVGPPDVRARFAGVVDDVVCLESPAQFQAVSQAYSSFAQTSDEEVVELLQRARTRATTAGEVTIPAGISGPGLAGVLEVPPSPSGLVLFAHGSGSTRLSPRNAAVARSLQEAGLATLRFDLLTEREARDRANVFDVELLGRRLVAATRFAAGCEPTSALPVGYFGASTGAAAALWAAAEPGTGVRAIVSRGGRPDLALERLPAVTAPTLLIVGGADQAVLALNRQAAACLRCTREVAVVPNATHLFEEPGALEQVGRLATAWFCRHLVPVR
jgi:putative phosphoribosyl transferase